MRGRRRNAVGCCRAIRQSRGAASPGLLGFIAETLLYTIIMHQPGCGESGCWAESHGPSQPPLFAIFCSLLPIYRGASYRSGLPGVAAVVPMLSKERRESTCNTCPSFHPYNDFATDSLTHYDCRSAVVMPADAVLGCLSQALPESAWKPPEWVTVHSSVSHRPLVLS